MSWKRHISESCKGWTHFHRRSIAAYGSELVIVPMGEDCGKCERCMSVILCFWNLDSIIFFAENCHGNHVATSKRDRRWYRVLKEDYFPRHAPAAPSVHVQRAKFGSIPCSTVLNGTVEIERCSAGWQARMQAAEICWRCLKCCGKGFQISNEWFLREWSFQSFWFSRILNFKLEQQNVTSSHLADSANCPLPPPSPLIQKRSYIVEAPLFHQKNYF